MISWWIYYCIKVYDDVSLMPWEWIRWNVERKCSLLGQYLLIITTLFNWCKVYRWTVLITLSHEHIVFVRTGKIVSTNRNSIFWSRFSENWEKQILKHASGRSVSSGVWIMRHLNGGVRSSRQHTVYAASEFAKFIPLLPLSLSLSVSPALSLSTSLYRHFYCPHKFKQVCEGTSLHIQGGLIWSSVLDMTYPFGVYELIFPACFVSPWSTMDFP